MATFGLLNLALTLTLWPRLNGVGRETSIGLTFVGRVYVVVAFVDSVEYPGESEVSDFYDKILCNEYVSRSQITVNEILSFQVKHSVGNLHSGKRRTTENKNRLRNTLP